MGTLVSRSLWKPGGRDMDGVTNFLACYSLVGQIRSGVPYFCLFVTRLGNNELTINWKWRSNSQKSESLVAAFDS